MTIHARASENPASLLSQRNQYGAGARLAQIAVSSRQIGDRAGYRANPIPLAGWHAFVPRDGGGLWEVRTGLPGGTISRVLFCFHGGTLVLLHGFIKKTRKTPDDELRVARKRQKEIEDDE